VDVCFRPVTLPDLKPTGGDLASVTLSQLSSQPMIPFYQGNTARWRLQNVYGKRTHARPNLYKMIPLGWFQIGNNRAGKIRIEEEILAEHLARTHPNLVETGTEFGFGHGSSHNSLPLPMPAVIWNIFFAIVRKLFT